MTNLEAVKALVRSMGDDTTMTEAIKVGVLAILEDMEPGNVPVQEQKKPEPKPEPKKTGRPKLDTGKMVACRKAGWSIAKIADEMGCTQKTVANHLHEAGVE